MTNNTALLAAIAAGDEMAFKELFDKHRQKLYNYLLKITKSKEIAEEIVIDVFLKLWLVREMTQEIHNMDAFLHKIAYNKAMDFFRISSRDATLQKIVQMEMAEAKEKQADHKMLDGEYNDLLAKALRQLSPRRRLIFNLSRQQGFTHEQIADELHITRNTVKNTVADTLKIIRKFLKNNDLNIIALLCTIMITELL